MHTSQSSSRRATRYRDIQVGQIDPSLVSSSDINLFNRALDLSKEHTSGGSYDMVAILSNPKPLGAGYNDLNGSAMYFYEDYPKACGIHAELNLWNNNQLRSKMVGGTVAVAGMINQSSNPMSNTLPCVYCAAVMHQSGVKWVIASLDKQIIKIRCSQLVLS